MMTDSGVLQIKNDQRGLQIWSTTHDDITLELYDDYDGSYVNTPLSFEDAVEIRNYLDSLLDRRNSKL